MEALQEDYAKTEQGKPRILRHPTVCRVVQTDRSATAHPDTAKPSGDPPRVRRHPRCTAPKKSRYGFAARRAPSVSRDKAESSDEAARSLHKIFPFPQCEKVPCGKAPTEFSHGFRGGEALFLRLDKTANRRYNKRRKTRKMSDRRGGRDAFHKNPESKG